MNILIIDDMQADHDICVAYLGNEDSNLRFYHAYNSEEGLSLYRQHPIDCVLLDYHLPDMNGLEVLRQLSMSEHLVPVIMMTAEGDEMVAVSAMKLGSQDYLPKKVITASALRRSVERAMERSEIIQKIEKYRQELERSNRDLELFATVVAHDLKSPLRAISQHLSLIKMKNETLLDDKSMRSMEFAVEGAERMRILIDALFEYAQLGFSTPSFNTVYLESVLESAISDLSVTIEEAGAIITHDPLPYICGDQILLTQLLQNMLANAIKYCTDPPRIHISAKEQDESWRIAIRDNGIGIDPAQREKIFTIFRRLHQEEYPGIGLGLAICDRIIKLHEGSIGVDSTPGKGSVFYFTLPAATILPVEKRGAYG